MNRYRLIGSSILVLVIAIGVCLGAWKYASIQETNAAAANQPEPMESVTVAVAKERTHRPTTTSIGTVTALRSVTLRNEIAGTVDKVMLTSGKVVEAGTVLLTIDTSVEYAELKEQEARADLAEASLRRIQSVAENRAVSEIEVDRARAEYEVALAQVARTKAVINRKIIRAPFRSRVGISDVHPGQYLEEGTQLTTLQGVDNATHVDFAVAQQVAAGLRKGDSVEIYPSGQPAIVAKIVAVDSRIDPTTRNATIRARIEGATNAPAPGASVRVEVSAGPVREAVAIPVSALRKGPSGDHVFVIAKEKDGKLRAHIRTVKSGTMLGDEVLILEGLSAGDHVATSGSFKLRDGALVTIGKDTESGPGGTR